MSTMLREVGEEMEVSTLAAPGKRRKIPRSAVLVPKRDVEGIKAEAERQAVQARIDLGIIEK